MKKYIFLLVAVLLAVTSVTAQIDSNNRKLDVYQEQGMIHDYEVETLYAYQLGVISAAQAANGVTNKWQGVFVIPLADNDEIHAVWYVPHQADLRYPLYVRWLLHVGDADSAASTITTTHDKVKMSTGLTAATHMVGNDAAGDGGTALNDTIAAITIEETETENTPFASDWGKINGVSTSNRFDALFIKMVSTANTAADRLRVVGLQIAYKRAKYGAYYQ